MTTQFTANAYESEASQYHHTVNNELGGKGVVLVAWPWSS